jgi:hypothetical protein
MTDQTEIDAPVAPLLNVISAATQKRSNTSRRRRSRSSPTIRGICIRQGTPVTLASTAF